MLAAEGVGVVSGDVLKPANRLDERSARILADNIKSSTVDLWEKLLRFYEGEGHLSLGYSSWAECWREEFGQSGSRGWQILGGARVVRQLREAGLTNVSPNEAQARELSRIPPGDRAEVWGRVRESGGEVTAREIRETAEKIGVVRPGLVEVRVREVYECQCPLCGNRHEATESRMGVEEWRE